MTYALIENDRVIEYPVYEGELRLRFPNISFPTPFVPPDGYVSINDVPRPLVNYTQNVTEGTPILVEGEWTRNWVVSDATPDQIQSRIERQWAEIRVGRNARLLNSDYTQLPDVPLNADQVEAWRIYRQQVRDITEQPDPFAIQWPVPPT